MGLVRLADLGHLEGLAGLEAQLHLADQYHPYRLLYLGGRQDLEDQFCPKYLAHPIYLAHLLRLFHLGRPCHLCRLFHRYCLLHLADLGDRLHLLYLEDL